MRKSIPNIRPYENYSEYLGVLTVPRTMSDPDKGESYKLRYHSGEYVADVLAVWVEKSRWGYVIKELYMSPHAKSTIVGFSFSKTRAEDRAHDHISALSRDLDMKNKISQLHPQKGRKSLEMRNGQVKVMGIRGLETRMLRERRR